MNNEFEINNTRMAAEMSRDQKLAQISRDWMVATAPYQYTYHFTWMGRPIIKYPQGVLAMQELIGTGGVVLPGVQT